MFDRLVFALCGFFISFSVWSQEPTDILKLKKMFQAFDQMDFKQAHKIALEVNKFDLWSDWSQFVLAESAYKEGVWYLERGEIRRSLLPLKKAISNYVHIEEESPFSPLLKIIPQKIAQVELRLGDAYVLEKLYPEAIRYYERAFLRLNGEKNLAQKLSYKTIQYFSQACRVENCTPWAKKLLAIYPKLSSEYQALSRSFPDLSKTVSRQSPPSKLTATYPSKDLDVMELEKAMSLYLNHDYSSAALAFEKLLAEYPKSSQRYRTRYFLAESLLKMGQRSRADIVFLNLAQDTPLSYYGLLAASAVGKKPGDFILSTLPQIENQDPNLNPLEIMRLKRTNILIQAGLILQAAEELKDFKSRDPFSNPFLVYMASLASVSENHRVSFQVLTELFSRGERELHSTYGLGLIFPLSKWAKIKNVASFYDPILILSLIKQESAFDGNATSVSGALGLMQLMPTTALEVDPKVTQEEVLYGEKNIKLGTQYFKKLSGRYKNNIVFSLAAYNAGPTATDKWIKETNPSQDLFSWIESIPYRETREYVTSVLRNYYWYSHLITGETLQLNRKAKMQDVSIFDGVVAPLQAQ